VSRLDYNKIKNLSASKRIPIKELARLCDLSEQGFHYMLKKQTMRVDTLEKICANLGVSPLDLFENENGDINPSSIIIPARSSDNNDQLMQKLDIIIELLRLQKIM
jgi:DNA-binding Xre family transcriptional regulator